jgi:hypothetical protein
MLNRLRPGVHRHLDRKRHGHGHPRLRALDLHEMVEYTPSLLEWKITAGIWALGLMIYTLALKIAINTCAVVPADAAGTLTTPNLRHLI